MAGIIVDVKNYDTDDGIFLSVSDSPTKAILDRLVRLFSTDPGERPNKIEYGCPLGDYLYSIEENVDDVIDSVVRIALNTFEPNLIINSLKVSKEYVIIKIDLSVTDSLTGTVVKFTYDVKGE